MESGLGLLFLIVLIAGLVLGHRLLDQAENRHHHYQLVASVLTENERHAWNVLQQQLPAGTYLLAKVRLIDVTKPIGRGQAGKNKVISKHLDFLLIEMSTGKPLLAIELDDQSHFAPSRQKADAVKSAALASAGLPLLRIHREDLGRQDLLRVPPAA